MVAQPTSLLRQASGWSIVWGVLLIAFGIVAIGSPLLAAVAVNALIAWLIILAGVVHVVVAFHAHGAGSLIWKLLVGLAYIFIGGYLLWHPVLGVASLTLLLASLFFIEGVNMGSAGHRRQSRRREWHHRRRSGHQSQA